MVRICRTNLGANGLGVERYYRPYARPNRIPAKGNRDKTHNRQGEPFPRRGRHHKQRLCKEFDERLTADCYLSFHTFIELGNPDTIRNRPKKNFFQYENQYRTDNKESKNAGNEIFERKFAKRQRFSVETPNENHKNPKYYANCYLPFHIFIIAKKF